MHLARDLICITPSEAELLIYAANKEYIGKFDVDNLIGKLNNAIDRIRKDSYAHIQERSPKP